MKKSLNKRFLDIGEVAKQSGLSPSALRFYEEEGLIRSAGRNGLRRYFDHRVLDRLEFIALGRQAGFSLEEIGATLTDNGGLKIDRKRLLAKSDQLDKQILRLLAVRDGLRHVAHCPAPSHLECPKFQRLLRRAGRHRRSGS